jgi:hypothetical protein
MPRRRRLPGRAPATGIVVAAALLVTSCLDRPSVEELISQPVIVTKRDPQADFASLATFAMTDSIPLLTSFDARPGAATVEPSLAGPTLQEISEQLSSRGYQLVPLADGPDLGVAVTAVNKLRLVSAAYGGWWGAGGATASYWGYSGAGLAAPISYQTVAWQSGTLIIELYDLRAARDELRRLQGGPTAAAPVVTAPIVVAWAAIIHGVVGEFGASLEAPPIAQIQQAFVQSQYLRSQVPREVQ